MWIFQCGIYGISTYSGTFWCGGNTLCKRICYCIQYFVVDGWIFVCHEKSKCKGDCKEYTYGTVYNCCVYRTYFIWIKCACAGYYRHSAFNDCRNKYTGFNDYYRCNYCGQQYGCSFKKQASV